MVTHYTAIKNILDFEFLVNNETCEVDHEDNKIDIGSISGANRIFFSDEEIVETNSYLESSRCAYSVIVESDTKTGMEALTNRLINTVHRYNNRAILNDSITGTVVKSSEDGMIARNAGGLQAGSPFTPDLYYTPLTRGSPYNLWANWSFKIPCLKFVPTYLSELHLGYLDIASAILTLSLNYTNFTHDYKVYGIDADSLPADFVSYLNQAIAGTTATTTFTVTSTDSPKTDYIIDVKTIIQEIVARSGWNALNLGFLVHCQADSGTIGFNSSKNETDDPTYIRPKLALTLNIKLDSSYPTRLQLLSGKTERKSNHYQQIIKIEAEFYG
jgi:hypothetical protein